MGALPWWEGGLGNHKQKVKWISGKVGFLSGILLFIVLHFGALTSNTYSCVSFLANGVSLCFLFFRYQQTLHRNLAFLATLADPNINIHSILPVSMIVILDRL